MASKKGPASDKAEKIARITAAAADEGKAEDIVVLEVSELTVLCDYFVICTGKSAPHLRALSEQISENVSRETGSSPIATEGDVSSRWLVLDYGSVIVHILSPEMREFYRLENIWGDAPRMLEFIPQLRSRKAEAS